MGPQEEYIETVVTCEGDFYDPEFHNHLQDFSNRLQNLLTEGHHQLIVKKVEPWNSVRVTFNIPKDAAVRLKQLAEKGDSTLRDMGVLAVQIEGDRSISLTIAGKNNETTELVLRTTGSSAAGGSSSVFDLPGSDDMNIPGPSNVESTRRNIVQYLREQGGAGDLFNSILNPAIMDNFRPPEVGAAAQMAPNSFFGQLPFVLPSRPGHSPAASSHSQQDQFPLPLGFPPMTIPSSSSPMSRAQTLSSGLTSHNQSSMSPNYPTPPPSVSNPSSPGSRTANHMAGNTLNNTPRLMGNRDITSSSPLLVNLLQNDGGLGHLNNLMPNKIPGMPFQHMTDMGQPPAKRKRRPRKPKTDAQKAKSPAGQEAVSSGLAHLPSAPGMNDGLQMQQEPNTVPVSQTLDTRTNPETSLHNSQEMELGNNTYYAISGASTGTLVSSVSSSGKSPFRIHQSPLRNCQSPGQAVSPRIQSPRVQSPGNMHSPGRSLSPARSKMSLNNPPHIVNPVTGQLEPAANTDIGSRSRGSLDSSFDNDDMVPTQLKPPPNPLVELKRDMAASTEHLEASMHSCKQSSPRLSPSTTESSHNIEAVVKSISEHCLAMMRSGVVSSTSGMPSANLVKTSISDCDFNPVGMHFALSGNRSLTTAPTVLSSSYNTNSPRLPTTFVPTFPNPVQSAVINEIPVAAVKTPIFAPLSTISLSPAAHISRVTTSLSDLPLQPKLVESTPQVSSYTPNPHLAGSIELSTPITSANVELPMQFSLPSERINNDAATTKEPVNSSSSTVVSFEFSSHHVNNLTSTEAISDQSLTKPHVSEQTKPPVMLFNALEPLAADQAYNTFNNSVTSSLSSSAITSHSVDAILANTSTCTLSMSSDSKAFDSRVSIHELTVLGKTISSNHSNAVKSDISGSDSLSEISGNEPNLPESLRSQESFPLDDITGMDKPVVNCLSPATVSSNVTPEHEQSGSDSSSIVAHSQGKDSGIADVGPRLHGKINCIVRDDIGSDTLDHSNGASVSEASPLSETDAVSCSHVMQFPSGRQTSISSTNHDSELSSHSFEDHTSSITLTNSVDHAPKYTCANTNDHAHIKNDIADEKSSRTDIHKCGPATVSETKVITVGYALSKDETSLDLSSGLKDKSLPFLTKPSNFVKDISSVMDLNEFSLPETMSTANSIQLTKKSMLQQSTLSNGEPEAKDHLNWIKTLKVSPKLLSKSDLNPGGISSQKPCEVMKLNLNHIQSEASVNGVDSVLHSNAVIKSEYDSKPVVGLSTFRNSVVKTVGLLPNNDNHNADAKSFEFSDLGLNPEMQTNPMVTEQETIKEDISSTPNPIKSETTGTPTESKSSSDCSAIIHEDATETSPAVSSTKVVSSQSKVDNSEKILQSTSSTSVGMLSNLVLANVNNSDCVKPVITASCSDVLPNEGTSVVLEPVETVATLQLEPSSPPMIVIDQATVETTQHQEHAITNMDINVPSATSRREITVSKHLDNGIAVSSKSSLIMAPGLTVPNAGSVLSSVVSNAPSTLSQPEKKLVELPLPKTSVTTIAETSLMMIECSASVTSVTEHLAPTPNNTFGASMVTTIVTSASSMGNKLTTSFSMQPRQTTFIPHLQSLATAMPCTAQVTAVVMTPFISQPTSTGVNAIPVVTPASLQNYSNLKQIVCETNVMQQARFEIVHNVVTSAPNVTPSSINPMQPATRNIVDCSKNKHCLEAAESHKKLVGVSTSVVAPSDIVLSTPLHILANPPMLNCVSAAAVTSVPSHIIPLHKTTCSNQQHTVLQSINQLPAQVLHTIQSTAITPTMSRAHHPPPQNNPLLNDNQHNVSDSSDTEIRCSADSKCDLTEKTDSKPSRGISIMKPLYDREFEIEEELHDVAPESENNLLTKPLKSDLILQEEIPPSHVVNSSHPKIKAHTVAQILSLKQKGILDNHIDSVNAHRPNIKEYILNSPIAQSKGSVMLDLSKSISSHNVNFFQKSMKTPASTLFSANSNPHPITSPEFPQNLTDKVLKVFPRADSTPPPSPMYNKNPLVSSLSPSRIRTKSVSPVADVVSRKSPNNHVVVTPDVSETDSMPSLDMNAPAALSHVLEVNNSTAESSSPNAVEKHTQNSNNTEDSSPVEDMPEIHRVEDADDSFNSEHSYSARPKSELVSPNKALVIDIPNNTLIECSDQVTLLSMPSPISLTSAAEERASLENVSPVSFDDAVPLSVSPSSVEIKIPDNAKFDASERFEYKDMSSIISPNKLVPLTKEGDGSNKPLVITIVGAQATPKESPQSESRISPNMIASAKESSIIDLSTIPMQQKPSNPDALNKCTKTNKRKSSNSDIIESSIEHDSKLSKCETDAESVRSISPVDFISLRRKGRSPSLDALSETSSIDGGSSRTRSGDSTERAESPAQRPLRMSTRNHGRRRNSPSDSSTDSMMKDDRAEMTMTKPLATRGSKRRMLSPNELELCDKKIKMDNEEVKSAEVSDDEESNDGKTKSNSVATTTFYNKSTTKVTPTKTKLNNSSPTSEEKQKGRKSALKAEVKEESTANKRGLKPKTSSEHKEEPPPQVLVKNEVSEEKVVKGKRTTRSSKAKLDHCELPNASQAKRRRSSRDHR